MSADGRDQVSDFSTFGQAAVAAKCLKVHRGAGEIPANLPRVRAYCGEHMEPQGLSPRPSGERYRIKSCPRAWSIGASYERRHGQRRRAGQPSREKTSRLGTELWPRRRSIEVPLAASGWRRETWDSREPWQVLRPSAGSFRRAVRRIRRFLCELTPRESTPALLPCHQTVSLMTRAQTPHGTLECKQPPGDGLASTAELGPLPACAFRGSGDWR
jgi:hypothetical protein